MFIFCFDNPNNDSNLVKIRVSGFCLNANLNILRHQIYYFVVIQTNKWANMYVLREDDVRKSRELSYRRKLIF